MEINSPENIPAGRGRMDMAKLKRAGAVTLPSLFTLTNMAFGFFAILSASDKEFSRAGWFIMGAIVMDMLDGRIARLVKGESSFGVEIDSLSDWISFGIAPSYIMYQFLLKDYGFWGYPVAFLYTMCGALRLARFNIIAHAGESSKQYFQGLPIPGAAGILASFVLAYSMLETDSPGRSLRIVMSNMPVIYGLIPFIMIGLSVLMVSNVPFAAFKQNYFIRPSSLGGILLIMFTLFLIIAYPQNSLFLFFTAYVAMGLIVWLWKVFAGIRKEISPGR